MSENGFDNKNDSDYTQVPNSEPTYSSQYDNMDYNNGSGKGNGQGLGIASMIIGIVSIIGCCGFWYVGIPGGIVAIVLGIVQIVKNESKGMAIAGIVCGAIGVILSILVLVGVAALVSSGTYYDLINGNY